MEASQQPTPPAAEEPDPFAEDAQPPAEPAPLPDPSPAEEPVEPPPGDTPPAGPAAEEPVEPLPGEGEDRAADAPPAGEPPAPEEPPAEEPQEPAPAEEPPAPPADNAKNRERDYTLMEKIGLGPLLQKLGIDASSLGTVADVLVYHPIHELPARNQETAISRTFAQDGPHGREFKGRVVTLPSSHLATKEVEVGVQTSVRVQIN